MRQEMRVLGLAVASAGPYANNMHNRVCYNTNTCLTALFPGLPRWAGTRKVKPIWILLKQMTVSGSGINWAICKSANCSRQTTTPALHHSVFYRPDALPAAQPTASKHWRQMGVLQNAQKSIFRLGSALDPRWGATTLSQTSEPTGEGDTPFPPVIAFGVSVSGVVFLKYDHLATLHAYGLHKYFKQVLWIHSTMLTKHVIKHLQFWVSEYTVQNCKIPSIYSEFASWNMCRESLFPVISILQRQ